MLCLMALLNFRINNSMPKFALLLIHRLGSKWEIHSVKWYKNIFLYSGILLDLCYYRHISPDIIS